MKARKKEKTASRQDNIQAVTMICRKAVRDHTLSFLGKLEKLF